jgi:hypothetical protein
LLSPNGKFLVSASVVSLLDDVVLSDQAYRWDSQEHDHQGLLTEDWMLNKSIGKANQPSSSFLEENGCIS